MMEMINLGNRVSNSYMVKLKKGYLLIDTGYPEQFKAFRKKLKEHGVGLKDIAYIFLTHAHDDHAGFLNEMLDNTDAMVIMHPEAVNRLRKGQNSFEGGCTSYVALAFCKIMKLLGKGAHRFPPVDRPKRYIILDESTKPMIEEMLSGKIMNLPGHTADSIGLLLSDGTLFCGDAAMNGIPSLHRIIIWIENVKDYSASWEVMINHHPSKIHPSHGKPFGKEDLKRNLHKLAGIRLYPLE